MKEIGFLLHVNKIFYGLIWLTVNEAKTTLKHLNKNRFQCIKNAKAIYTLIDRN